MSTSDLTTVRRLMEDKIQMLRRAEYMEDKGDSQIAKAISDEWDGAVVEQLLTITVDDFVRQ
jgi:hypothetical protein